jgi:cellulose biosynthesis protein BcsQ
MTPTKILMYSFKGGSGRTTSTANVALVLAKDMARRVVLLDIDIESAGLSVLFKLDKPVREGLWTIQDILRGYALGRKDLGGGNRKNETIRVVRADFEASLWPKVHSTIWDGKNAYLKVLPSQIVLRTDKEVKISSNEGQHQFEQLLMQIDDLQDFPEIVMLDSSSGQQDTAMFGLQNSHVVVIFVRWSRQFIVGTSQFLWEYICQDASCSKIERVFIVPTAVPARRPPGRLENELALREQQFKDTISLVNDKARSNFGVDLGWIQLLEPIHECEALKWDDRVFLFEDDAFQDEPGVGDLMKDYRRLASTLSDVHISRSKKAGAERAV